MRRDPPRVNRTRQLLFADELYEAYRRIAEDLEHLHRLWRQASRPEREPRKVERSLKAKLETERLFEVMRNWEEQDMVARVMAKRCYLLAEGFLAASDVKNGRYFYELLTRFMRLSQHAKKEFDLDRLDERMKKVEAQRIDAP